MGGAFPQTKIPMPGTNPLDSHSTRNSRLWLLRARRKLAAFTLAAGFLQTGQFLLHADDSVPPPWTGSDIGSPGQSGGAAYDSRSSTWNENGGGSDIWNTSDQFHFTYYRLTGDGSLVTRVVSLQNTDAWAKAGVMIRASLDPSSTFADVMITPGNGACFQYHHHGRPMYPCRSERFSSWMGKDPENGQFDQRLLFDRRQYLEPGRNHRDHHE